MDIDNRHLKLSKLRTNLFPVHRSEIKKFLSLGIMFTLIVFNFWVAHNSKEILVIMAEGSGAEALNYLKLPVFIVSVAFIMGYTWAANVAKQHVVFQTILGVFVIGYSLFTFVIYPHQEYFHMSPQALKVWQDAYPSFQHFFPIVGYWGFSLYYILSELWGAVVLTLLFWQLANQITTVEQSKRFYMLFGSFNGLGAIIAGYFSLYYANPAVLGLQNSPEAYQETFMHMMKIFIGVCVAIMLLYHWISRNVVRRKDEYDPNKAHVDKQHKIELSFWESIKYILSSRYLGHIAVITLAYNFALNFAEVTWKSQLKSLYCTAYAFQEYMGQLIVWMGILTILMGILGTSLMRHFSWTFSALITPVIALILGGIFFYINCLNDVPGFLVFLNMTPLVLCVTIGFYFDLLYRSSKYSFFNATREMAFIPLDAELKVKGKAAIDVISGRVGKMGASLIQVFLLAIIPGHNQGSIVPYLGIFFLAIIICWILSIHALNKKFLALTK
jgi:ATP:ADP antiporter, AAA family